MLEAGQFDDENEIRSAYWHVAPGDVVIDVGCGVGSYTIPALEAGATVVAVDPFQDYLTELWANCTAQGASTSRLITVCEALAAPGGYSPELWAGMAGARWPHLLAQRGHAFATLDELADRLELDRLDWLKIDVEGAELGVLQGGLESLRRWHPKLIIEDHTLVYEFVRAMGSEAACLALLGELGYVIEKVPYTSPLSVPRTFWVSA